MKPIIVCSPVRNELHNLTRMVPTWRCFADHIVVADNMSGDGSKEFLAQFDNVHVVDNTMPGYNEANRIPLMLAKARSLSDSAVLVFLDADETLSANVTTSLEWQSFRKELPGTTGFFPWITLWGSVKRYIARGPIGTPTHIACAFVDDGRSAEDTKTIHGPRGPGLARPQRRFYFNDVALLHFLVTNREVFRKKQNWYKFYWISRGAKYFYTNRNHILYDDVGIQHTEPSPEAWYRGYEQAGLDISSYASPELLSYDIDILRYMAGKDARRLWWADIWNQDWEYLRSLAIKQGEAGMPETPIVPPPRWLMRYTDWTLGRIRARDKLHSLRRFIKRKILP